MAQPEPGLNPIEHLWRTLKMSVRHSPSNLRGLERIFREEWQEIAKCRCAKLVTSYPKRLKGIVHPKMKI